MSRAGLDEQIAAAERAAQAAPDAEVLSRLGNLYLRAGRVEQAHRTLLEARRLLPPLVEGEDGAVELATLWEELLELVERCEAALGDRQRAARRQELVAGLERPGGLSRELHEELIALELKDGAPLHPEPPRCPGCRGPLREEQGGSVRCARTGVDGDLCRHVDARDLFRCRPCGLVIRAWNREAQGRLRPDPAEPPTATVRRPRCGHCQASVADWTQHVRGCPKARPVEFPLCPTCRQRGFHARSVVCPRCNAEATVIPCLERQKRGPR